MMPGKTSPTEYGKNRLVQQIHNPVWEGTMDLFDTIHHIAILPEQRSGFPKSMGSHGRVTSPMEDVIPTTPVIDMGSYADTSQGTCD